MGTSYIETEAEQRTSFKWNKNGVHVNYKERISSLFCPLETYPVFLSDCHSTDHVQAFALLSENLFFNLNI